MFVVYLSDILIKKKTITVEGKIFGSISYKILGKNGFGYDPIFIPKNYKETFGQMKKMKKLKLITDLLLLKIKEKKTTFFYKFIFSRFYKYINPVKPFYL